MKEAVVLLKGISCDDCFSSEASVCVWADGFFSSGPAAVVGQIIHLTDQIWVNVTVGLKAGEQLLPSGWSTVDGARHVQSDGRRLSLEAANPLRRHVLIQVVRGRPVTWADQDQTFVSENFRHLEVFHVQDHLLCALLRGGTWRGLQPLKLKSDFNHKILNFSLKILT